MNGYCSQVSLWWALMIRFAKTSFSLINTVSFVHAMAAANSTKDTPYCISLFFLNGLLFSYQILPGVSKFWRFLLWYCSNIPELSSHRAGDDGTGEVSLWQVSRGYLRHFLFKKLCYVQIFSICLMLILGLYSIKGRFCIHTCHLGSFQL